MSKCLPEGKAYGCPKCSKPMRPHDGPWDVVHCVSCQRSVDLWYETPVVIDVDQPVVPFKPALIVAQVVRKQGSNSSPEPRCSILTAMSELLRRYLRLAVRESQARVPNQLLPPDGGEGSSAEGEGSTPEEGVSEFCGVGGGAVQGFTAPLGSGQRKKKRRQ